MNNNFDQGNNQPTPISPTPITSQSSYNQAQNNMGANPPKYSNNINDNKKPFNFIIIMAIVLSAFSIIGVTFATMNKSKIYKSSATTDTNGQKIPSPLYTEANDEPSNTKINNQKQSTGNNNNTSPLPIINKDWKKYTTTRYNLSFYYPSTLTLYKGNPGNSYVLYDVGIYPPKDPKSNVIKLGSSISVSINSKSRIADSYQNVTVNTQSGTFNAIAKSGPYRDTGGILYEFEFNKNGLYYYYTMFNASSDTIIMTTDEFRQLIESSTISE